nr:CAZy families GH77/CBM20 protein [uncultured Bacteroides sp.]
MLTILPLQDWMSVDDKWRLRPEQEERINVPAISNYYWRYRMQMSLEALIERHETNNKIREMVKKCKTD